MSLQVCHCGWSKVTSYHGLRIHQGKMGCTPQGIKIPESDQYHWANQGLPTKQHDPWLDFYTPIKDDPTHSSSDLSLQVCHCGWSKMTSYHGLRIHQGKMGCTPQGMRIPECDQYIWKNQWEEAQQRDTWRDNSTHVKKENVLVSPSADTKSNAAAAATPIKHETTSRLGSDGTPYHTFEKERKERNPEAVRRALDFSTGLKVGQLVWEPPTTTYQETKTRPEETKQKPSQAKLERIKADLQQKVQMREQKVDEIEVSVKAYKESLDREWQEISTVFTDVMRAVEEARREALQPLEERKRRAKREAKDLIQELQREISKLKKTIAELDTNSDLQVSPSITGLNDYRDWKRVTVDTSFSCGTLRTTTSTMMQQIQHKLEKLSSIELKRMPKFEVDVKLDPTTAHTQLILSDDGKEVRDGGQIQEAPDAPERFDLFGSVLGLNKLTSGKSYWEVEVSNKTGWDLGVARGNANRKGKLCLNPDNGYWVTVHYNDKQYAALTAPPTLLSLRERPQTVGVFVDYEEGLVSFYDVKACSHIYSFTGCSFTGELYPYLSPHLKQEEKNSGPLIISPVKHRSRFCKS